MIIVLDTNVLVSGLLTPFGPPARVVDQVVSTNVQVAFDDRIIDEYTAVLTRPKFHFEPRNVEALIDHIRSVGIHITATPLGVTEIPDPTDLPFAEVAVSANADALVTGNQGHFEFLDKYGIAVLSPAQLMETIERLAAE